MTALTSNEVSDRTFEREKLCYEQNFLQFRAMNQAMWQVPLLAISITGGLWYAAIAVPAAHDFRRMLFAFAGVLDLSLALVLVRVRYVMGAYLAKLEAFHPPAFVQAPGTHFLNGRNMVLRAFLFALAAAVAGSALGFFEPVWMR